MQRISLAFLSMLLLLLAPLSLQNCATPPAAEKTTEATPDASKEVAPEAAPELPKEAAPEPPAERPDASEPRPEEVLPEPPPPEPAPDCLPTKAAWDSHAQALFTRYCGQCHGDPTDFGAPFGLLSYSDILQGAEGKRKSDRMAARLIAGTMPPVGYPRPPHEDADTMVQWLTCGTQHATHSGGLESSAPVWTAPTQPPKDTLSFDLRAPDFAVGEKVLDLYQCFVFENPLQEERFIRRVEMLIDQSRVLHHTVFLRDVKKLGPAVPYECRGLPSNTDYLYSWAPGTGPIQFPDGGLRIRPGERFIIQMHYNNGAGLKDIKDKSGIRVYHGPLQGTEYGMISPGPMTFSIRAGETKTVQSGCGYEAPVRILAGMPHMHEIGSEFLQEIVRKDGTKEKLIQLKGWSFENQLFYSIPTTLNPGDRLLTACTWKNTTTKNVYAGTGTKDEMCFNFMYVTPPQPERFCDQPVDPTKEVPYTPGTCSDPQATRNPPQIIGSFAIGSPPALKGGTIPEARWLLDQAMIYLDSANTPFGEFDLQASRIPSKGQMKTGPKAYLDLVTRLELKLKGGFSFTQDVPTSLAGTIQAGATPDAAVLKPDCGSTANFNFKYEIDQDTLRITTTQRTNGITLKPFFTFKLDKSTPQTP